MAARTKAGTRQVEPVDEVDEVDEVRATEDPKPGVLLRSYRLSLRTVEWTGTTVGGNALGALRVVGLPKGPTQKLQSGQKAALHGVTAWSDDVGTKVAHGIGAGKSLAAQGAKVGVKTWARGMRFFITLH